MRKATFIAVMLLTITALVIAGCTKKTEDATDSAKDKPTYGGTVTYAYIQPFKGLLEPAFYEGDDDYLILNFISEGMFKTGDDLKMHPNLATWTESADHTTFTFIIEKNVKWHNGEELTAEDWKFAFEVIANKQSNSPRWENVEMIVGAREYRENTADSISGIKVIDPHTIEITVNEAAPNTLDFLWNYPMPKKYYEGIPLDQLADSEQIRQKPVGLGPFQVKKVQSGEFVEMTRYDDYWKGKPYLDGVVYKIIDGSLATSLLSNGEIDIMSLPASQNQDAKKLNNIDLIEDDLLAYSYIGFKFGRWDAENEINVMDNPKFADKRLRQAMSYAIDRQKLLDSFSNGIGTPLGAPMPTASWAKIPDDQLNMYNYNPETAKKLLDEAGYIDVDGDGMREDPQGEKFMIHFDAMLATEIDEPRALAILQFWQDIGLNVQLNGGALKDFNTFYDAVEFDDPSVELYMGTWGLDNDPDPTGLWRSTDEWNYNRWVNAESDRLIEEGVNEKAFDETLRKQVYYDWQKLVNEELPSIFLYAPAGITAKNNRLQGVHSNAMTNQVDTHLWWVTQ